MPEFLEEPSLDTGPLLSKQLSDNEWKILFAVERRLKEVEQLPAQSAHHLTQRAKRCDFTASPLATAEERYQRVLLLDGGRGAGKTSVLLTFVKRWHGAARGLDETPWNIDEIAKARLNALRDSGEAIPPDIAAPKNVRVIRNLDFDPLPTEMPLVAGIVQAWRSLVEHYDQEAYPNDQLCDDDDHPRLMDQWHRLFRVAAVGWSGLSQARGLIEQVLDREEQVRDWQDLREQWVWFVNEVIRIGRCLKGTDQLEDHPVFVIVIDDVDLQVSRIRELLPALRLLTHPNVFFLVAADSEHMLGMLKLDFLGQQNALAHHSNASSSSALDLADADRWASDLARSAFAKVFPKRNVWKLKNKLSLAEFLAYPDHVSTMTDDEAVAPLERHCTIQAGESNWTFRDVLNRIKPNEKISEDKDKGAGEIIANLAHFATGADVALPVMTYRDARQLRHALMSTSSKELQAVDTLARLLSGNIADGAKVIDGTAIVEVFRTGELAAFYPATFVESGPPDLVLSGRPDFVFVESGTAVVSKLRDADLTAGLVSALLAELEFPVDAAGLRWQTFRSLAWTEWPRVQAFFSWNRHKHPRPDKLFEQTYAWRKFFKNIQERRKFLERLAFQWIYFQRKWNDAEVSESLDLTDKGKEEPDFDWVALLDFDTVAEKEKWQTETIPLLARPEIGFPPEVQERLIRFVEHDYEAKKWLQRERSRLATDALFAGSVKINKVGGIEKDSVVKGILEEIGREYVELNDGLNHWDKIDPAATVEPTSRSAPHKTDS